MRRWAAASGCRLCVHFGSTASGSGGVEGDVDVALDFERLPDPRRRLQIIGELHDLCAPRQADVAFLRAETDPVVRFEIFRTGRPLHEAHPGLFVEETVRALALYEDALPFRRALRKQLKAPGPGSFSMTRDVLARKLARLRVYLADLSPHAGKSAEQLLDDRYEVERLLELLVQVAVDIVSHELAERGKTPDSYRGAFLSAHREGLLPADLADRLADAAGLRNVLVHLYEEIDYEIVAGSIEKALRDFGLFLELYAARLDEDVGS